MEQRYIFLVRQTFGDEPQVDAFYQVQSTDYGEMTPDQVKIMETLGAKYEIAKSDRRAITGMQMRYRFNQDMFQGICMVRTDGELSRDVLNVFIKGKHATGELKDWLEESKIA